MQVIEIAKLLLGMGVDDKPLDEGLKSAREKIAAQGEELKKVGANLSTFVTLPILAAGAGMVKLASDAEEMQAKFDVVFGAAGDKVSGALDEFALSVGRSKFELRGMAAELGDLFVPLGFTKSQAGDLSVQMTKLATDLSSFNNMPMDEALARLRGTLVGSHENALAFGVVINENTLKAELAEKGWDKLTGAALEQAKVQARLNLLLAGTRDAQGDAERTAGSFANQTRALFSALKDLGTEIGTILLPVATWLVDKIQGLVGWFGSLGEKGQTLVLALGAITAAIGPLIWAAGALLPLFAGAGGLAAALTALVSPIGLVVLGIAAVVAAVAAAVIYWDDIVYLLQKGWLNFKITFLEVVGDILLKAETWVNGILDVIRPMADFLGIDVPDRISLGQKAVAETVEDAKADLAALEASHKAAKEEAEALQGAQEAIAAPSVTGSVNALGEITTAAGGAAGATGDLKTALEGDLPKPGVSNVIGELERIELEGLDPLVTSFGEAGTQADAGLAVIGSEMLRDGGSFDQIEGAAEDLFVDENGMIRYVKDFDAETERVLSDGILDYMKTDFVDGFKLALGEQGVGGAIKATAKLFADGGPESVTNALGDVIGKMVGVSDDTVQGAMGSAFAALVRGDYVGAIKTLIGSIPGIGTAFQALDSVFQAFGISMDGVIRGIVEGVKEILGLAGQTGQDVLVSIEAAFRQQLAAGNSAAEAIGAVTYQFAQAMERFGITAEQVQNIGLGVFGLSAGPGTGTSIEQALALDELRSLAGNYGLGQLGGQEVFDAIFADFFFGLGNLNRIRDKYGLSQEEAENLLRDVLGLGRVQTGDWGQFTTDLVAGLIESVASADLAAPWEEIFRQAANLLDDPFMLGALRPAYDALGEREFRDILLEIGQMLGIKNEGERQALTDWVAMMLDLVASITPPDPAAGRVAGTGFTTNPDSLFTTGLDFGTGRSTTQQISIFLDGQLLGQAAAEHLPDYLELHGIA